MDLSKLSDADLMALKSGDLSKVSDAGLLHMKNVGSPPVKVDPTQAAQMALEGMSPMERVAANFGSGIADLNPFQSRQEVDDKRIRDAVLNDTTAGKGLNIAGQVLPTLALPFGAIGRLAGSGMKAAGALGLGEKIAQSKAADMILTGTALGAAAPVGTNDSRVANAAIGTAGGAVVPAVGALYRGGKSIIAPFTQEGAKGIAGKALADIGVPSNVAADEIVLGSKPTLVQATQNPMVAQVEKTLANRNPNFRADLGISSAEQNMARLNTLGRVTGTVDDLAAAEAAREAKAAPIRESALKNSKQPNIQALVDVVDMLGGGPTRLRSNASSALGDVRQKLTDSRSSADLYAVRKEIDDMISGRVNGDKKGVQYAAAELMQVKNAIDEALNQATNGKFGKYLETYIDASKPVNRMEAAQKFAGKFDAAIPDQFGNPTLTQGNWRRAMASPEKMFDGSKTSTQNKLSGLLNIGDNGLLDNISQDLMRQFQAQRLTSAAGSDTVQNLEGNKLLKMLSMAPKPTGGGGLINSLIDMVSGATSKRPIAELEKALLDPKYAGVLAQLVAQAKQGPTPLLGSGGGFNALRMLTEGATTAGGRFIPSQAGQ